jgi:pyruvate/2-oxoglutarate/acetoin dehydrogenase E1 component
MPEITLVQAVNLALARAMADDPSVLVVGEDVGAEGGVFRATEGLLDRFGADRVPRMVSARCRRSSSPASSIRQSTSW